MKLATAFGLALSFGLLAACGPSVNDGTGGGDDTGGDDDDGSGPDARPNGPCEPSGVEDTPATCSDSIDQDCDGLYDCQDPSCSGVGECPVCGQVDTSEGTGIMLPDGIGIGTNCQTNADCSGNTPNCIENECHGSYTSTLNVIGFGDNQTFDSPDIIESICINSEHSWIRDLEIRLVAPGGQVVRLQRFMGRTPVEEVYFGQANDCDEDGPTAGTGALYCWAPAPSVAMTMLEYANDEALGSSPSCDGPASPQLPPDTYSASDPWTQFNGSPMNGNWTLVVTDLWAMDNGFLFDWQITFNADEVGDCSGPIVD